MVGLFISSYLAFMKMGFFLKVFLTAFLFFLSSLCFAQTNQVEYKIKAGYLYNFTKFISWPDDESATFNLCIVGKDPFGSIINPIEKRDVKNKPIRLFRYHSISEVKHCHMIYFTESEKNTRKPKFLLPEISGINLYKDTLTITDSLQFAQSEGMIAFSIKRGKVKLHINITALKKSGLEVSAKLLEVAEIYEGIGLN
jgi:hypothetical protein